MIKKLKEILVHLFEKLKKIFSPKKVSETTSEAVSETKNEEIRFFTPLELYIEQLEDILETAQQIVSLRLFKARLNSDNRYAKEIFKDQFYNSKFLFYCQELRLKRHLKTKIDNFYFDCLSIYGVAPIREFQLFYDSLVELTTSNYNRFILRAFIEECEKEEKVKPPSEFFRKFR